jgi:hypothetical protein
MKQRILTSTPAIVTRSKHQHWLKLDVRIFRRGGRVWQRFLTTFLLLISLLLSPVGLIPAYALDIPVLIAPIDSSTTTFDEAPPLGIPEFEWAAVSGATSYRLQVSSNIGFTTTIVNITTPNTTYTPTSSSVFSDGTWYWRVRVEAPAPIGDYTGIWSFTKQWATSDNKPTLSSPLDSATIDFYDKPLFSWNPLTGAAKYKLQIYSSSGGWSNLTYSATTLVTTNQPNTKLINGTYYWRVVPVDPGGHDGTPSEERSFIASYNFVPTLLEPENFANPTFTPTFSWTAVRGAEFYRLQYSTDPSFSSGVTQIDTRNISYTPTSTMPNDVNFYWRIRTHSGNSISDWTPSRSFIKKWYIKPVLLTPTNNYQDQRFPIFSWTPVPGTSYYKVEISINPGFSPLYDSGNTANTFFTLTKYDGGLKTYYWRVTPYDGNAKAGVPSNTSSYVSYSTSVAPQQVYPLYYYPPDTYSGFPGVTTNPHEDRTVPLPIFIWHRVYKPAGDPNQGEIYADAYRLQVSTNPTFSTVDWTVDTENLAATPSAANPFTTLSNTDYFWRVRPLIGGIETGKWSQIWKTRIDLSQGLTPTTDSNPRLIRPTNGFEFAETTPLLEWFPVSGATSYDVQISLDSSFTTTLDSVTVSYPSYSPTQSLAQRSLGAVDFGVYYWRVSKTGGNWSETRRFQISAQSQWQSTRTLGAAANQLQIGSDAASDVTDPDYDLTDLQVAQSSNYWYLGFRVPSSPIKNVTYGLYLDLDHQDASGATFDALGYSVTTIPAYQPEYAIYVFQEAGVFTAANVYLYHWNGGNWDTVNVLNSIGGRLNQTGDYVELEVPNTAIGYQDTTGSYAISLFSLSSVGSGAPQDSVPSNPSIPGTGPISRFANVTERLNLSMPPNDAGVDPTTYTSIQPFFWDWPVLSPWSGAIMKAYLDPLFTTEAATYTLTSNTPYYAQISHAWGYDFLGDNTYYWRIRPTYLTTTPRPFGAWSQGWRFERQGFIPQNLQTSVTFATPTFSWDMVEGAESYDLQVDNDPGFGSTAININTRQNSYTHISTLANATYYWRVRVHRNGSVINNWTSNQTFTLALPVPDGLNHEPSGVVGRAPTLCWTPLIVNSPAGDPVLAAWKYRVQVSKEPTFSSVFDTIDTQQSCWTPTKGYDDGQYHWRVAMIDGDGKLGGYSTYQTFTKQYPITTLLSPPNGSTVENTPTFAWTPVNGAARYKLEVSLYSNFSSTVDSVTTDNTSYTPTKAYTTKKTYYWRVAIVDADGKIGPYNNATIIIDPNPGPFSKTNPSDGAIYQLTNPTLSWEASTGATSYEYCYSITNPCTNWTDNGSATSVTLSGLLFNETYYWHVMAVNPAGTTYANGSIAAVWSFTTKQNPAPVLSSISPSSKWAGRPGFTLNVYGKKFSSGAVVRWNGSDRPTTFVSMYLLTATISADDIASAGTATITVFNPAPFGGLSNATTFTINNYVPVITGLSPASKNMGKPGFTLNVYGKKFGTGAKVRWNGSDRPTTYVNMYLLTATISAADISSGGLASVTVFNPAPFGGLSNATTFTINNDVPVITGLSPASKIHGKPGFTLNVYGKKFSSGAVVHWNGSDRPTTFVSMYVLTATISAADIATVGTASVRVFNPTPGGGLSNAITFTIQ